MDAATSQNQAAASNPLAALFGIPPPAPAATGTAAPLTTDAAPSQPNASPLPNPWAPQGAAGGGAPAGLAGLGLGGMGGLGGLGGMMGGGAGGMPPDMGSMMQVSVCGALGGNGECMEC